MSDSRDYQGLLSRGGAALGLAACAVARGNAKKDDAGWRVLSDPIWKGAQQIVDRLLDGVQEHSLQGALDLAMGAGPPVSAPVWTRPLWSDPDIISRLGERCLVHHWPPGSGCVTSDPMVAGLAALAVAFSRNLDTVRALCEKLENPLGEQLVEMAVLASCTVEPGEPSAVRAGVKQFVLEELHG